MVGEFIVRVYERVVRPAVDRLYTRVLVKKIGVVGRNVRIHGSVTVRDPGNLNIGDDVRIGAGCFLFCKGGLSIGANSQLSRQITIYTANHNVEGNAIPYDDTYVCAPVRIGRSVWIGMNAAILPGVTIGDGAIVGLGTVVSKDVPAGAIVVGAAQRVVGYRDSARFGKNEIERRYFGSLWPDA